jgi:hypothetical protein
MSVQPTVIFLDGDHLSIDQVTAIARCGAEIRLTPETACWSGDVPPIQRLNRFRVMEKRPPICYAEREWIEGRIRLVRRLLQA